MSASESHVLPFTDTVFQHVVEQSPIAISITDAQANIRYVNPAFCRITGYAMEQVVGQNQSLLSYKTTPREVYAAMWGALKDGRAWSGRLLNRRADGLPYVAELTVTPLATVAGEGHYLGMHWDATEAHRLEQQLQNNKRLVDSVVEVAPMAVAVLDSEGLLVLGNSAYRRIVSEMGMSNPASEVAVALRQSLGDEYERALAQRRPLLNHELRFERPGSRDARWYACSLTWFEEADASADAFYGENRSNYMLLVMHDVTAARRQEEALRLAAMRAMLSEGELNQSLREALSGAIFQLQGPVNLITAAATLQKRRATGQKHPDPLVHALSDAQRAGEEAIATLRAALPPEPVAQVGPVNLNEVLRDVLMLSTDALLSAGITVDWKPAHVLPTVPGDPAALRTMMRQLVENAIEAMNVRGWNERALSIESRAVNGRVEVELTDTGPGIPAALRLKVFEPFFSTKQGGTTPSGGARGVGLSLAQDVVRRHNGVLEFDPDHIGGCKVRITLPCNRDVEGGAGEGLR